MQIKEIIKKNSENIKGIKKESKNTTYLEILVYYISLDAMKMLQFLHVKIIELTIFFITASWFTENKNK